MKPLSLVLLLCLAACGGPAAVVFPSPSPAVVDRPAMAQSPTAAVLLAETTVTPPAFGHSPPPATWMLTDRSRTPFFNPQSTDYWQVDLRTADLRSIDLRESLDALLNGNFDTQTHWPQESMMPEGFDWQKVMALGRNPGLGIRALHDQGITGRGVSIAIIDQPLLLDHPEYAARLRRYEEAEDINPNWEASMHGGAVVSIAVGQQSGVAPEADVYYFATGFCSNGKENNYVCLAETVRRVLAFNQGLPEGHKIRVITTEVGWGPQSKGYDSITKAAQEVKAAGILFVSSSMEQVYGYKFHGMGRDPLADPDAFESYGPGWFWTKDFAAGKARYTDRLMIPMDSRTTAGPHSPDDYVFYRQGGWSWAEPWIAGLYALAVQVRPALTPDEFWAAALKTGRFIQVKVNGENVPFGPIVDPAALIGALR